MHPALSVGEQALKVLVGILFTFAVAAYWIFERERTVDLVTSFLPRPKRKTVRDTWTLIDQKLGAFVRGELVLIAFVSTLASIALGLVGEPYWLLIGIAVGISRGRSHRRAPHRATPGRRRGFDRVFRTRQWSRDRHCW